MKDQEIFEQLERLGAAFPWEGVQIWIKRSPEGVFDFTSHVEGCEELGFPAEFDSAKTIAEAIERMINQNSKEHQNAERARKAKIMELELQLARLKQTGPLALPPFRPCLLLGVSNPAPEPDPKVPGSRPAPAYVNVESRKDDVPF